MKPAKTKLTVALMVEAPDGCVLDGSVHSFDLSVGPWVLYLGGRWSMPFLAQASSNAWAQKSSAFAMASFINGTAEPPAPGVGNWMPLSVSTVWIL